MSELNPEKSSPAPDDVSLPVLAPESPAWAKAHFILLGFLGVGLVIWLLSGFYKVNAGEAAIVERLGYFLRNVEQEPGKPSQVEWMDAGLHYHLPYPIDVVHFVPIQQNQT